MRSEQVCMFERLVAMRDSPRFSTFDGWNGYTVHQVAFAGSATVFHAKHCSQLERLNCYRP